MFFWASFLELVKYYSPFFIQRAPFLVCSFYLGHACSTAVRKRACDRAKRIGHACVRPCQTHRFTAFAPPSQPAGRVCAKRLGRVRTPLSTCWMGLSLDWTSLQLPGGSVQGGRARCDASWQVLARFQGRQRTLRPHPASVHVDCSQRMGVLGDLCPLVLFVLWYQFGFRCECECGCWCRVYVTCFVQVWVWFCMACFVLPTSCSWGWEGRGGVGRTRPCACGEVY